MRTNVAAGVFIGALVVLMVSLIKGWTVLIVLAIAVMVGTLIAAGNQLRVDRNAGNDRPWRDR